MKCFDWDDAKNATLRAESGMGFEDIVFRIERGDVLDILEHPHPQRYADQRSVGDRLTSGHSREAVLARLRDNPGDSLVNPEAVGIKLHHCSLRPRRNERASLVRQMISNDLTLTRL